MESDDEEADQAASIMPRTCWLFVSLIACQQLDRATVRWEITDLKPEKKPVEPPLAKPIKKKKKKIYLTFDDGPNHGTAKVFSIVRQENIPVSFFLVGEHAFASAGQKEMWDSLRIAEAIDLCNHSYSHAHNRYTSYYKDPGGVVEDFKRCKDSLNLLNEIGRTPGRNCWRIDTLQYTDLKASKAAVDSLQQAGFVIMGWDLEWHYRHKDLALEKTAEEMLLQIDSIFLHQKTRTPEHLVLLAHDQVYANAEDSMELHSFIKKIKKNEAYELELVSSYPGVKKVDTSILVDKKVQ